MNSSGNGVGSVKRHGRFVLRKSLVLEVLRGTALSGPPLSNDSFPLWSPHGVLRALVFAPLCSFNKGPSVGRFQRPSREGSGKEGID